MPTVITRGAISARGYGFAGGRSTAPLYPTFIGMVSGSVSEVAGAIFRSDGTIGLLGSPTFNTAIMNLSSSGAYVNGIIANATSYNQASNAVESSSGDIIFGSSGYMGSYSSAGSMTFLKEAGSNQYYGGSSPCYTAVDSSGNIYQVKQNYDNASTNLQATIVKTDSSGTVSWVRYAVPYSGVNSSPFGISVYGSNVYAGYSTTSGSAALYINLVTSGGGTLGTFKLTGYGSVPSNGAALLGDSSGNVYVYNYFRMVKLNSSGVIQWTKSYSGVNSSTQRPSMCWSSDGSTILLSVRSSSSGFGNTVIKIDPSTGVASAAVSLVPTTGSAGTSNNLAPITARGNRIFCGNATKGMFYVIPENFTRTGTYSVGGDTVTYSSVSITTTTYSDITSTLVSNGLTTATPVNANSSTSALTAPSISTVSV